MFGPTARDTAGPDSDVDILVAFDGPATSARYFGVQFHLEDLLGRSVDLVTEKALRERLRPGVECDAIAIRDVCAPCCPTVGGDDSEAIAIVHA